MKPFLILAATLAISAQDNASTPDLRTMSNTWSGDPRCHSAHPNFPADAVRRWDGYTASDGAKYACPIDETCVMNHLKTSEGLDIGRLYQACTLSRCISETRYAELCEASIKPAKNYAELMAEAETKPPEEKPGLIDELGRIRADLNGHVIDCAQEIDGNSVQEWHSYRSYEGDKLICPMSSECLKLTREGPLNKLIKKFESKGYRNHALSDEMCVVYKHCVLERHFQTVCKNRRKAEIMIVPEPKR